ncbi:MAG: stage V sporulation protein S [Actinobacteria bacterium]|nr:stage V sporulation protein S [Actinomycetota bacterium]MBU4450968.1 stage V sporulation protein S [Actinomycetota bacterium]MCG2789910.1 stage V sporulation protein S [Actinomycetes bacterium]
MKLLKVSSKSAPNSVAGAIAGIIRTENKVQIQTIGAGALNQTIKAIAIARGYIAPTGQDLICVPFFRDIDVNGEVKTAIVITVEVR